MNSSRNIIFWGDNANIVNKTITAATNVPTTQPKNIIISNCNNNVMIPLLLHGILSIK